MMANNNSSSFSSSSIIDRIIFRAVQPTDIPRCFDIESRSYPEDEAASKSTLQYRQHHAAPFFRCAFLIDNGSSNSYTDISSISNSNMRSPMGTTSTSNPVSRQGRSTPMNLQATLKGRIIGFICATRCSSFTAESMKSHDATGKILAIHSVVVEEKFRNSGVASAMIQDYLSAMERLNGKNGTLKVKMDKVVLMAKKNLLAFYVRNGFKAMGVSDVVHGREQWFELERDLPRGDDEKYKCYLLDCFADVNQEGSGNIAAVVLLNGTPGGLGEDEPTINNSMDDELDDIMEEDGNNNNAPTISPRGVEWMRVVAKEFNQPETAFVWPLSNNQVSLEPYSLSLQQQQLSAPPTAFGIRYYSKSGVEVDLCGHATLASAAALFGPSNECHGNNITFYAKNDVLKAEQVISPALPSGAAAMMSNQCNNSNSSRIAMDFPWKDVTAIPDGGEEQKAVLNMLSTAFFGTSIKAEVESDLMAKFIEFFNPKEQSHTLFSQHILFIGTTDAKEDLFIELTEEGFDLLRDIKVYYSALSEWEGYSRGVIICCCAGNETPPETIENGGTSRSNVNRPGNPVIDFRSRFFGPKIGIDEDPVTGSAHCSLGPYFGTKLEKKVVIGKQESERGGLVECILKKEEGRVGLVGTACVTVSGMLSMPL